MQETVAVTSTVGDAASTAFFGYLLTIVVAMAAAGFIWAIVRVLEAMQKKSAAAKPPAAVTVAVAASPKPVDETTQHVAAIAAAIYAVIGAHRLVHIGEASPSVGWRTTGRAIHQTSHMPGRSPSRG